jgi:hypothetical protein
MSGQLPVIQLTTRSITRSIAREREGKAGQPVGSLPTQASEHTTRPASGAMLNVPWKAGVAAPERGEVQIAATEARLGHYRDLPGAAIAALRLRRSWRSLDGAIALWLAAQPLKRTTHFA